MKTCYIAGPYRAPTLEGVQENVAKAIEVAMKYYRAGYAPIIPHLNTPQEQGLTEKEIMAVDLTLVGMVDFIIMLKNWEASEGARMEHQHAKKLKKLILYDDGGEQ